MQRRLSRPFLLTVPAGRPLALVALVDSIGTGLFLAASTVFAIRVVGLSGTEFGLAMSSAGAVGLVAGVPLGRLGDRVGARSLLVALQVWRAAWFVVLAFSTNFWTFLIAAAMLAAGEAATPPATQAVVAAVAGTERVRAMASLRVLRNVGFSVGALAASPLLVVGDRGAQVAVLVDALSFLVAAVALFRIRAAQQPRPVAGTAAVDVRAGLRDWPFVRLTILNCLLSTHLTLLTIGIPLWLVTATDVSDGVIPILLATNTVVVVALQVRLSRRAETTSGAQRALVLAAFGTAACCCLLAIAGKAPAPWVVVAFLSATLALTAAEIWQSAGAWELSFSFSPEARRVEYLSVFNLGTSFQDVIGPVLVTSVVIAHGTAGWLVLAATFCVIPLVIPSVVRPLAIRHEAPSPTQDAGV